MKTDITISQERNEQYPYSELFGERLPKVLYRYGVWGDYPLHAKNILTKRELYFADPRTLNDPNETEFRMNFDLDDRARALKSARRGIKRQHPDWNRERCRKEAQKRYRNVIRDPKRFEIAMQRNRAQYGSLVGIVSMSECNDNPLLWSHYASKHQGLCVGFETEKLLYHLLILYNGLQKESAMLHRVTYGERTANPSWYDPQEMQRMLKEVLTRKSKHWEYEKEWRFTRVKFSGSRSAIIPEKCFQSITFGYSMTTYNRSEIANVVACWKIKPQLMEAINDSATGEIRVRNVQ